MTRKKVSARFLVKGIVLLVGVIALGILVLQNTQRVVTRLWFISISMPLALLLTLTMLAGVAGGILATLFIFSNPVQHVHQQPRKN